MSVSVFGEIRVRNAGVAGDSSARGLKRIHTDVIAYKPDAVVIMFGINDSCNPAELQSISQYSANLEGMIDALKASGCSNIVVVSPHNIASELLLARSPGIAERLSGRTMRDYIRDYADAAMKVAAGKDVHCLDWHAVSASAIGSGMEVGSIIRNHLNCGVADGIHFTSAGNVQLAEAVYRALQHTGVRDGGLVICLGDSITASVHVVGAGGVTGETYPAILWRLLNPSLALSGRHPSAVTLEISGKVPLLNTDLEEADNKGRPAHFPFWEKGTDRFVLLKDAPYRGSACARLSGSAGSKAVARTDFFPVKGGMTFRVSMRVRGKGACEIIAGTYEPDRKHTLGKPELTDEWQLFEAEYRIPAGAVRSCIIFNTNGTLDFDDLTVTGAE